MKVIAAGLTKTGTKSLAEALRILGYDKVYDFEEAVEFALDGWEKIFSCESVDVNAVIEKYYTDGVNAVIDVPHSIFFDHFFRRWPDAKVILTVRDEESQYRSYKKMTNDYNTSYWFIARIARYFSPTSQKFVTFDKGIQAAYWGASKMNSLMLKGQIHRHNAYVKSVIPKEQLLVYAITEGWEPLCKFLGRDIPRQKFPHRNRTGSNDQIADLLLQRSRVFHQIRVEVAQFFLIFFVVMCFFAWLFFGDI